MIMMRILACILLTIAILILKHPPKKGKHH